MPDELDAFLDGKIDKLPPRDKYDDFLDADDTVKKPKSFADGTFVEKAALGVSEAARYPLGLPADPRRVGTAIADLAARNPQRGYMELMPRFERAADIVKRVKTGAIGNIASKATEAGMSPTVAAAGATGLDMALDIAPFEPSSFAMPQIPLAMRGLRSAMRLPFQSPAKLEAGIESSFRGLGREGLTQEAAGQQLQSIYDKRLGSPLREMTKPPVEAPRYQARAGQEIFVPEYEKVAKQVYPVGVEKRVAGQVVGKQLESNFDALQKNERAQWMSLSEKHFDAPAKLDAPKEYLKSVVEEQGITLPTILKKIVDMEDASFGKLKALRSEIGSSIEWRGRGDQLNHVKKEVYRRLTDEMGKSASVGGFEGDVSSAMQASKDFFKYSDLPTSKIISKAKYPENIVKRLIRAESPSQVEELFTQHNLSKQAKQAIRRNVLDDMAKQKDPRKFAAALDKMGDSTKRAIFGEQTELVESLKNTVKVLDDEIAKSKVRTQKGRAYGPEDILSKNGLELDNLMKKSRASELVSNVMKDGTPEMARTIGGAVGKDGMNLLRRAAVQDIVEKIKLPTEGGGTTLKTKDVAKSLSKMSPEFIREFFGDDAKIILGLRDASMFYREQMKRIAPFDVGSYPIKEEIMGLARLWKKYRLPARTKNVLANVVGEKQANKMLSPLDLPPAKTRVPPLGVAPYLTDEY